MSNVKKSSGELVYEALLSQIRSGHFQAGDRLREEEVAERLKFSRTPIREALRRLENDGIVEHRPRVGAVIRSLSRTEMVELYEMRIVLERTAAQMAAKHGADAEFDALDALNDEIDAARETPSRAASLNQDFHRGLYHAGRNRFLLDASRALNNALLILGPTTYTDAGRLDVVVNDHRAIIAGLRAGDPDAAAKAAEAHLQTSLRHRLKASTE